MLLLTTLRKAGEPHKQESVYLNEEQYPMEIEPLGDESTSARMDGVRRDPLSIDKMMIVFLFSTKVCETGAAIIVSFPLSLPWKTDETKHGRRTDS